MKARASLCSKEKRVTCCDTHEGKVTFLEKSMGEKRMTTYQYRIKDGNKRSRRALQRFASAVNFIWNYVNETSALAFKRDRKWLSNADLDLLLTGSSKLLGVHSQTIQAISKEHANRRKQFGKCKLRWRTAKKNLGWVPFKASGVKLQEDRLAYQGTTLRFWKSRDWPVNATLKTGQFSQDARGRWYVSLQFEVQGFLPHEGTKENGIDLGLKHLATLSDGSTYSRENLTKKHEEKLAMAQRAHKKKQVQTAHAKIANQRMDWAHKSTTHIVHQSLCIAVGMLQIVGMMKTKMAKSVADAAWGQWIELLFYKAIAHGISCIQVSESYTTQTCHGCQQRTGPRGIEGLKMRQWCCSQCGMEHERDVNAAMNIFHKAYGRWPNQPPKGSKAPKDGLCSLLGETEAVSSALGCGLCKRPKPGEGSEDKHRSHRSGHGSPNEGIPLLKRLRAEGGEDVNFSPPLPSLLSKKSFHGSFLVSASVFQRPCITGFVWCVIFIEILHVC